jgi:hypothetical protein
VSSTPDCSDLSSGAAVDRAGKPPLERSSNHHIRGIAQGEVRIYIAFISIVD